MLCFTVHNDWVQEGIAFEREPFAHVPLGYMLQSKIPVRIPIDVLLARKLYDNIIYNMTVVRAENGLPLLIEENGQYDDRAIVLVRIHGDLCGIHYELPESLTVVTSQIVYRPSDFPPDGKKIAGVLPLASAYISHIVYDRHIPYETKLILLEKGAAFMVRRADSAQEQKSERVILWTGSRLLVRTLLEMNGCMRRG